MNGRAQRVGGLRRALDGSLAALLAVPVLVAIGFAVPAKVAHAADTLDVRPGDDIALEVPDCGSKNVDDMSVARFRTNIGSGSTIFVGTNITIKASVVNTILGPPYGNDGPDPLILDLTPTGALQQTAPTKGSPADYQHNVTWGGDGSTGPIEPVGKWGYKFDANSSPVIVPVAGSDGTDEMITISFKPTAPGLIDVSALKLTGTDATPPSGPVKCSIFPKIFYRVIPLLPPVTGIDIAYTDASYTKAHPDDATTGRHGVAIYPLKNDTDPNLPFDSNEPNVRIVAWSSNLDCGGVNGAVPTTANFDGLTQGPCIYEPEENSGFDGAWYTMVQRSGLIQDTVDVIINIVPNYPIETSVPEYELSPGTPNTLDSLLPSIVDPDNDPVVCIPGSAAATAGSFTVTTGCSFDFDAPFAGQDVTASYLVCDTHPTLSSNNMGDAVRNADYSLDTAPGTDHDLDVDHTRRCTEGTVIFHVKALGLLPAIQVRNDADVVDTAYLGESPVNGPYKLVVDVFANDDFLGGTPTSLTQVGVAPDPAKGAFAIIPNSSRIRFTSVEGYVGPTQMTYRACADVGNPVQNVCKTAKVLITVKGNQAPKPKPDDFGILQKDPYVRSVVANDKEPDIEALLCSTTLQNATAGAFAAVSLAANCQLSFQATADYVGPASVTYKVCDNHVLQSPLWYDQQNGYGPFDIPGGNAPRCSTATASMTFENALVEPPAPPDPVNGPTCNDDVFVTVQNVSVVADVLANDSDVGENDEPQPLALLAPDQPDTAQAGTVVVEGNALRYTPAAGFVGVDSAPYGAVDIDALGCGATVTFTVKADADGDGIPNDADPDIDGDGIPNDADPDADGDGVPNESDPDVDGDGIPNEQDLDNNSDGIPDSEQTPPVPQMPEVIAELPATGAGTASVAITAFVLLGGGIALLGGARRRRGGATLRR